MIGDRGCHDVLLVLVRVRRMLRSPINAFLHMLRFRNHCCRVERSGRGARALAPRAENPSPVRLPDVRKCPTVVRHHAARATPYSAADASRSPAKDVASATVAQATTYTPRAVTLAATVA